MERLSRFGSQQLDLHPSLLASLSSISQAGAAMITELDFLSLGLF